MMYEEKLASIRNCQKILDELETLIDNDNLTQDQANVWIEKVKDYMNHNV